MNIYTPHCWITVEVVVNNETHHRILCGWTGGYTYADRWKLSSGIVHIVDTGSSYHIHNTSGSVYACYKNCEHLNHHTQSVYNHYHKQHNTTNSFKVVPITTLLSKYE